MKAEMVANDPAAAQVTSKVLLVDSLGEREGDLTPRIPIKPTSFFPQERHPTVEITRHAAPAKFIGVINSLGESPSFPLVSAVVFLLETQTTS